MSEKKQPELIRGLGPWDTTLLVIGNIIGVGIFTTTGVIAGAVHHPGWIMLVWLLGGIASLCGALCYAELGAAIPKAGGDYVYLREAYGPFWGFLNGWTAFWVTFSGSIAVLAVGCVEYLNRFIPGLSPGIGGQLTAILIIVILSVINYIGLKAGSGVQNGLTILKVTAVLLLVFLGFLVGKGHVENLSTSSGIPIEKGLFSGLGLGLIGVTFAYYGWAATAYVAGEVRNPQRDLPLSLCLGTGVVILIYLALNAVFLYGLPAEEMAGVINIAEVASVRLFGHRAATFISLAIIVSILGCLNATILTGPRIYYAMAKDELFFRWASRVHLRFRTPALAIILQMVWSCGLVLILGTFEKLLVFTVFIMVLLSAAVGVGVYVLRVRRPELERPFRVWGYPVTPAIFILVSMWILINTLIERPLEPLRGIIIIVVGMPVYWYWRRKRIRLGKGNISS
ncbi:amino acid permease [candidate division KSB1 bacterium]|nr:amino acid permease [candidate division KSB1 bacterium]